MLFDARPDASAQVLDTDLGGSVDFQELHEGLRKMTHLQPNVRAPFLVQTFRALYKLDSLQDGDALTDPILLSRCVQIHLSMDDFQRITRWPYKQRPIY